MKPILCNTQVVQNILAGRQKQDRRPIKPQPNVKDDGSWRWDHKAKGIGRYGTNLAYMLKELPACAPHQPGDVLYVRETWRVNSIGYVCREHNDRNTVEVEYDAMPGCARGDREGYCVTDTELVRANHYYEKHSANCTSSFSPNIHMPKWAARIFLKITGIRVERIQDISDKDIEAEGVDFDSEHASLCFSIAEQPYPNDLVNGSPRRTLMKKLWNSIYPGSWERNDFVWVYSFEKIEK